MISLEYPSVTSLDKIDGPCCQCDSLQYTNTTGADIDHCDRYCGEQDNCIDLSILLSSLHDQIRSQYNMDQPIVSGGLQQYMNRQRHQNKEEANKHQPIKGFGSETTTFHDLPESVQLHIFSFLDAKSLCRISGTCQHWLRVSEDDLLWQRKLETDVKTWDRISQATYPGLYRDCQSDWLFKEIYLRCSPEINSLMRSDFFGFHSLSNMLRSFLPKKTPKLVMFGPGLESSTSSIVRKILEDKSGIFNVTGMFPGQFEGLGSGFTIKTKSSQFSLITLYGSTKRERENRNDGANRLEHNRLFSKQTDEEDSEYEVTQAVKDLCQTIDGFIYVVDVTVDSHSVKESKRELKAMLNQLWTSTSIPLVVLACKPHIEGKPTMPVIDVVEHLDLASLTRPWQVRSCNVEIIDSINPALDWVTETSQRR